MTSSNAEVPQSLLPGCPINVDTAVTLGHHRSEDSSLYHHTAAGQAALAASKLRSQTMMPSSSSAPAAEISHGHRVRSVSVDAEAIEHYSQRVSDDVRNLKHLNRLRTRRASTQRTFTNNPAYYFSAKLPATLSSSGSSLRKNSIEYLLRSLLSNTTRLVMHLL